MRNQDHPVSPASPFREDLKNLAAHISPNGSNAHHLLAQTRSEDLSQADRAAGRYARIAAAAALAVAARVCLYEDGKVALSSEHGSWPKEAAELEARVLRDSATVVVPDVAVELPGETGFGFYAGVPVPGEDGRATAGVISVVDTDPRPDWAQADTEILEDIAAELSHNIFLRVGLGEFSSALIESEDRFRRLYNSIPIGVYRTTTDGQVLVANPAFARILGFDTVEKLLQEAPDFHFRKETSKQFLDALVAEQDEIKGLESEWRRHDGSTVPVRENAVLVRTPQGDPASIEGTVEDLTEAKRMDMALRTTESRFQAFMEHVPGAAFIKDESGKRIFGNQAFASLLDKTPEEIRNTDSDEFLPPDVAERVRVNDRAVLESNCAMQFMERLPDTHGVSHDWLSIKFPFESGNGARLLGGIAIDVTERVKAVEALQESQERLQLAQTAAGISSWDRNLLTEELIWSPEQYRLFGVDASAPASHKLWLSRIHPADRAAVLREFNPAKADASLSAEYRVVLPGGHIRWIQSIGKILRDTAGRPVRLLGVCMDITERRLTEDALRASEQRFRTAAENASDVIFEWEMRANRVRWYGRVRETLGLGPESLPDTMDGVLAMVHREDAERVRHALSRLLRERVSHEEEFRVVMPGGAVIDVRHRGAVLVDSNGEPMKVIGVAVDITQRKHAEAEQARLAALVQSSSDAIVSLSRKGIVVTWNRGAEDMLGHEAASVQGKPWAELAGNGKSKEFGRLLEKAQHGQSINGFESLLHCAGGEDLPVSLSMSPIVLPSGEVAGISVIARDITERKRAAELLTHQALHDLLTGLPNRRLLHSQLKQAIARASRRNEIAALLYIDLDGFKLVNDTFGHGMGDDLLRKVAQRLSSRTRAGDTLARTGGDEFMLVAEGIQTTDDAFKLAQQLLDSLVEPFQLGGRDLFVSASIGLSMYPSDAQDAVSLERGADAAMYEAKRNGKNQVFFYTQAMGRALRERMELGNDLRRSLESSELRIEYQPQFRLQGMRLSGMEALLRWRHGRLGPIKPEKFIPIAEETGAIVPIGDWILEQVCRQIHVWRLNGAPSFTAAVNVSPAQFVAADFVEKVRKIVDRTGVDPHQLEIELTESVFLRDFRSVITKMRKLRDMGIGLVLDDFGSGYSSLTYLLKLPINGIKLDRSFVSAIGRPGTGIELIHAIVALAHNLGLRVVAEGVENPDQVAVLRNLGCDEGQGFLLGHPAPAGQWDVRLQTMGVNR